MILLIASSFVEDILRALGLLPPAPLQSIYSSASLETNDFQNIQPESPHAYHRIMSHTHVVGSADPINHSNPGPRGVEKLYRKNRKTLHQRKFKFEDDEGECSETDLYYVDDDAAERDGSTIIVSASHSTRKNSESHITLTTEDSYPETMRQHLTESEDLNSRKCSMWVEDYCEHAGYSCQTIKTVTEDGFILVMHRLGRKDGIVLDKGPVLLMHGLFQSSGVWVTSGKKSFAFYLVDNGYDVWMGNNRAVFPLHTTYTPSDVRYWDYSLDDLALYDIPALINNILLKTNTSKLAYIGHSQGNAQLFLALQMIPPLNDKITCFVALAPAVYLGDLLDSFPVCLLMRCPGKLHRRLFGVKAFVPIMSLVQRIFPAKIFMILAYHMFHYLFSWSDRNWNPTHKPSYFQFTPRPQSSKSIHHWSQMGRAKVIQPFQHNPSNTSPTTAYNVTSITCPLALYYGTRDTIIDARKLHRECWAARNRGGESEGGDGDGHKSGGGGVRLVAVEEVDGYEHMDCLWAVDAESRVWRRVIKVLRSPN